MGLTNDIVKDLKCVVIGKDHNEKNNKHEIAHQKLVQQKLKTLYEEIENFENKLSNICLAKMIVMNDLKRISLLKNNNIKEAYDIAKQNDKTKGKKLLIN